MRHTAGVVLCVTILVGLMLSGSALAELGLMPDAALDAARDSLMQDADFPMMPTPAQKVAMLRNESLEQTLFRLGNLNMFFSPGPVQSGRIIWNWEQRVPISGAREFYSVRVVMANRRVFKLYEDLQALPAEEAGERMRVRLLELLDQYLLAYAEDKQIKNSQSFTKANAPCVSVGAHGSIFGVGFICSTVDPNEVTLPGLRYAVLSLVMLAGALELEAANDAVVAVAEKSVLQRDGIYADTVHHDAYRESVLELLSIYNRTIVGNALIGTSPRARSLVSGGNAPPLERRTLRQARYDAHSPALEQDRGMGAFSHGDIEITYFDGITDELFDALLRAAEGGG